MQLRQILLLLFLFIQAQLNAGGLPSIDVVYEGAHAKTEGNTLIVDTDVYRQIWKWTGHGLVTTSIFDKVANREWCNIEPAFGADWNLAGIIENESPCEIIRISAFADNDEGFTSTFLKIEVEMAYSSGIALRFDIWAFPSANGLRSQLYVKGLPEFKNPYLAENGSKTKQSYHENFDTNRVSYIPLSAKGLNRRAIGYNAGTQQRNTANLPLLEEQLVTGSFLQPETYTWPSILVLEDAKGGLISVDENHKCANVQGLNTGAFMVTHAGISNTGWGLTLEDIRKNKYRSLWATWTILYTGQESERQLAIKAFDRLRYPVDPQRDMYIMANTWGSGRDMEAAQESNVLAEIESQSDLGIDVQQIDDGWQNPEGVRWMETISWRPHPERYPIGWERVRKYANKKGLQLGLWQAVGMHSQDFLCQYGDRAITLDDLKWNYDRGGFRYFKCDFSLIQSYDDLEKLTDMTRSFILYTAHAARVNWDVTETKPRIGYFFGREYGNLYLANRKPKRGPNVVYVPYLMLRDAWHVSKYVNLNKVQISVQNIDLCDQQLSNAHRYNHPYSVAISLMGSPIFFQETQRYSDQARTHIKPLLSLYKEHRRALFQGIVYPVGEEPNDHSWTGFQCHLKDKHSGYLLIFRELNNQEETKQISLHFINGKEVTLKNLQSGETVHRKADRFGRIEFNLPNPASFSFYQYNVGESETDKHP